MPEESVTTLCYLVTKDWAMRCGGMNHRDLKNIYISCDKSKTLLFFLYYDCGHNKKIQMV